MSTTSFTNPAATVASTNGTVLHAAPPKRRPNIFGRPWVALLALTDMSMFFVAAFVAVEIVTKGTYRLGDSAVVTVSTAIYAAFWLLIFERLGLYRRSFAMSVRDELYATAAALALGALPQFVLFTILPAVSSSRSVLLLSVVLAMITVGGSRALLHAVRVHVTSRFPERIAVVGETGRLKAALESLNFPPGTPLLPLVEGDVESTLEGFDFVHNASLNRIPWLRQARAWGCDTILLTEILPPADAAAAARSRGARTDTYCLCTAAVVRARLHVYASHGRSPGVDRAVSAPRMSPIGPADQTCA